MGVWRGVNELVFPLTKRSPKSFLVLSDMSLCNCTRGVDVGERREGGLCFSFFQLVGYYDIIFSCLVLAMSSWMMLLHQLCEDPSSTEWNSLAMESEK